ncbi:hypothetical protein ACE6H2_021251 [Prunus campanulata]
MHAVINMLICFCFQTYFLAHCIRKSARQTTIVTSAMQTILMLNIVAHNLQLKVLSVGVFKRLVSQMVFYEQSLPVAFYSSLSEKKLDKAVIKSCLGSWCVRLGWEVFVNHHGLNLGEMVVFEHKRKMVFNVVAYESLGNEKEYELQSDKH